MTRDQNIIRRKLNMVELGEVLGNVSEACRRLSVSRQHRYNTERTNQGKHCQGRTPMETFLAGKELLLQSSACSSNSSWNSLLRAIFLLKNQTIVGILSAKQAEWVKFKLQLESLNASQYGNICHQLPKKKS
jgi:hypothetical protein